MIAKLKNIRRKLFKLCRPWSYAKVLQARIDHITDIGVYPAAVVGGDKPYEKRSEWQEGWNAHGKEILERYVECTKSDWDCKTFLREQKEFDRDNVSYKTLWLREQKRERKRIKRQNWKMRPRIFFNFVFRKHPRC